MSNPPTTAAQARALVAAGRSPEQAAAELGVPLHVVARALERGDRGRPRKHDDDAVRVTITLPGKLHARLEREAQRTRASLSDVVVARLDRRGRER